MRYTAISLFVVLMVLVAQAAMPGAVKSRFGGKPTLASDKTLTSTWRELIDAFLDGSDINKIVSKNSTTCAHDFEDSWDDINEAVDHFIVRGWSWENWVDLNGAVGTFAPLIRVCYDVTFISKQDLDYYIGSFDSLVDFAVQAKDNVLRHIFDWYDVITKLNDAYAKQKDKDVAYQVGRALNLFFYFVPKMPAQNQILTVRDIPSFRWLEEIFKGFINGTQVLSSKNVKNCINNTEFLVKSIEDANVQFRKQTDAGFREGVFELADIFSVLKPLNVDCYVGYGDVQAVIQKYIKTFTSPLDIAFNAAKHFNQLYVAGIDLVQKYYNSEWYQLGYDAGQIFFYIFFDH
jgi:hypothetical protein